MIDYNIQSYEPVDNSNPSERPLCLQWEARARTGAKLTLGEGSKSAQACNPVAI